MRNQKIYFITGKGGVGKSTVALALAAQLAQRDQQVLLAELGQHSFFADHLSTAVDYQPMPFKKNLDLCLWSGKNCLKEYALHLLKIEALYKILFENRVSKSLIDIAPSLPELAILGKITSGLRQVGPPLSYDAVVVDCYATGHMMALLKAPRGMYEAVKFGPMGEQTKTMLDIIRDPDHSKFYIVSLPEELPITESLELHHAISEEVGVSPNFILNKILPEEDVKNLKAENKGEDDFLQLLRLRISREKRLKSRLESQLHSRQQELIEVPFFYETDPLILMEKMKEALSALP